MGAPERWEREAVGIVRATVLRQVSVEFCSSAKNKCGWMESSTYISVKTAREPKHGAAHALSSSEGWETKTLLQRQKKKKKHPHIMTALGKLRKGGVEGNGGKMHMPASKIPIS